MSQKERIIREATVMFFNIGLKSVRMDDIATTIGVSKRTLYEMFGDKKTLLEECVIHHATGKRKQVEEQTDGTQNVMEEIFSILNSMKRNEKEVSFMDNLRKFYPDIYNSRIEEMHQYCYCELAKMFDRGIRQKHFLPTINKELALMTLVYTMTALFERRYYFPVMDKISPREAFKYVIVNYFRGMSTQDGIALIDELVIKYNKDGGLSNEND